MLRAQRQKGRLVRDGRIRVVFRFALAFLAAGVLLLSGSPTIAAGPAPAPLISRGVPVFASSQLYAASDANDADYTTVWRGSIPGWIAYNLSGVPAAQRGQVIIGWYNDPMTSPYDHTVVGEIAYNSLRDYTIQANPAPNGASAPTAGWVTLGTVTSNHYHSRQHLVNMTGYNWIRLNITAGDGSSGNSDASFNLDVHDASQGAQDSWIFLGDSITMDGTHHEPVNGTGNFSQLISAGRPGTYPAYEDGGIGGLLSSDGAQRIGTWLSTFPGRYVGLSYGTNDANGCADTTAFYNNYVTMVQAVLSAGKIPVVPTIPWARTSNIQNCGPGFNAKIQALYTAYPQIVKGPDLWAFFKANQSLISTDDLHPSAAGYAAYRQQWANAMLANVYTISPAVSLLPASLAFATQTLGTTSGAQSVTLQNTGSAPLTISGISLGGANPGDFAQSTGCPLSPATLAANASCTISVTFTPSASGSRMASVQVSDNAPGSPHSVGLSGSGTNSAIAFDKSLGTNSDNVANAKMKLTTTAGAASRSRVFLLVNWNNASRTLASVSGGGLSWTVDIQAKDASNNRGAIASADAPAGLASGTVITATFSGSVKHGLIAAASFTGIASTSAVDVTGSNTQAGVAGWTGSVTTTNASDLVLGWSGINANSTSTATAPNIEIHDFGNVNLNEWATSAYRIESSTGSKTVNGTWLTPTAASVNITVLAAYKAA